MTEQVLNILKFVLLGLLYLFFARVLWAVWSEVRTPSRRPMVNAPRTGAPHPNAATAGMARPAAPGVPPVAAPVAVAGAAAAAGTQRRKDKRAAGKQRGRGRATRLVMLEPKARRGVTIPLGTGDVTIGRDPSCTVAIEDDAYVSTLHLRFYDYEGQPMVEDLGSTNGTFHNGGRLTGSKLLHPGDRIQVGTTVIEAQ
jgi:hypothetical protein